MRSSPPHVSPRLRRHTLHSCATENTRTADDAAAENIPVPSENFMVFGQPTCPNSIQ